MGQSHLSTPLIEALLACRKTRQFLAGQLRNMADATGDYCQFEDVSRWTKAIWRAAADALEESGATITPVVEKKPESL